MIEKTSDLFGWKIEGQDGLAGTVADLVFDHQEWAVPFIVIESKEDQSGIKSLIPTADVQQADPEERLIKVNLRLEQIKNSPKIDPKEPISEQILRNLNDYAHWLEKYRQSFSQETGDHSEEEGARTPVPDRQPFYFRSAQEVMDYRVKVRDGEAGKVNDFIIDIENWIVLYLIIDVGFWLSERLVLMAPTWVEEIRDYEKSIWMDLKRETIEKSPAYDPDEPLTRQYEERLYKHYQRPGYWDSRNKYILGQTNGNLKLFLEGRAGGMEMSEKWEKELQILGIVGSLRQGSYNQALLRAAQQLAPEWMRIHIFDNETLSQIPLYDQSVHQQGMPEPVQTLKNAIQESQGLILASPEDIQTISRVLKNAQDWASRPADDSPLDGMPVAIISASTGNYGDVRTQMHLRQVCVDTNMIPLNQPQLLITRAHEQFDGNRNLVNETSRFFLREQMIAFAEWAAWVSKKWSYEEIRGI